MRGLFLLLLLAGPAAAVDFPLGPYGRPGVPLPLRSKRAVLLSLDGWPVSVPADETVEAFLPRAPLSLRDAEGKEQGSVAAVPEKTLLFGVVGPTPPDLASRVSHVRGFQVRVVPLAAETLPADWRCYDLFDRIAVVSEEAPAGARAALAKWARAGGTLLVAGAATGSFRAAGGLGEIRTGPDLDVLLRTAPPLGPLAIPRPAAVQPELYSLVPPIEISPAPLASARTIVWGAAAAAALLLLLGALLRIDRRALLSGLAAISGAGLLLGFFLTEGRYRPEARADLTVAWAGKSELRERRFAVYVSLGRARRLPLPAGAQPVLYRSGSPPWGAENRRFLLPAGGARIFRIESLREETEAPPSRPADLRGRKGGAESRADLALLVSLTAPSGVSFRAWLPARIPAPSNAPGPSVPQGRLLFFVQR